MVNHKCISCGKIYDELCEDILSGCICGGKSFYFVKSNKKSKLSNNLKNDLKSINSSSNVLINGEPGEDVEYLYEYDNENKELIIFDIESVHVQENGKYDINVNGLFNSSLDNSGLVYKYEDGKYSIDLDSEFKKSKKNR